MSDRRPGTSVAAIRRPACRIEEQGVRFSPRLFGLFELWLRGYLGRHFNAVRVANEAGRFDTLRARVPNRGLVVYSNHPSWWDPILFFVAGGRVFPGHAGFGPMDAEQLERYRFFRRLGIFGVEEGSARGAAAFLRAARQILAQDDCLLWVTAQGDFVDARQRPVRLQSGLGHLASRLAPRVGGLTFVPCAVELVHWSERLPEALLRFGEPLHVSGEADDRHSVRVSDWTQLFERRLEQTQDDLAAAAVARDPSRFSSLLAGRRGVGGVYDLWRRVRASLTGRSFDPAHLDST